MTRRDDRSVRSLRLHRGQKGGATSPGESWADLTTRVAGLSAPDLPFFLLVTLSTTIAAFGLLSNSTAVVIGAMLVAPLMGPIFGIAFGLAVGDTALLARATGAELKGAALSVGLALAIGLVPNHPEFGAEILARTHPTLYDLIVAVASGLAGAFALADERVSPALPGVAIATAIVPPLATAGLCLSIGRVDLAGGAFLLFLANLLAIEVVAAAYFTWIGVRRAGLHERVSLADFLRHFGVSAVLLVGVGVFLTRTLLDGIAQSTRRELVHRTLADEVRLTQGARLTDLSLETGDDTLRVFAVVMTPQEVPADQVARLEAGLRRRVHGPVHLVVRSLIARDADRTGPVYTEQEELARRADAAADSAAKRRTRVLSLASEVLRARFAAQPGVELEELRRERRPVAALAALAALATPVDTTRPDSTPRASGDALAAAAPLGDTPVDTIDVLTAVVRTPIAITPAEVASLDSAIGVALGRRIRLVVRSLLTRDADATGFLFGPPKP